MKRNRREFLGLAALAPGSLAIGGLPLVARAAKLGPNARAGTPREAATFGDVVMISVHDQIAAALD